MLLVLDVNDYPWRGWCAGAERENVEEFSGRVAQPGDPTCLSNVERGMKACPEFMRKEGTMGKEPSDTKG